MESYKVALVDKIVDNYDYLEGYSFGYADTMDEINQKWVLPLQEKFTPECNLARCLDISDTEQIIDFGSWVAYLYVKRVEK